MLFLGCTLHSELAHLLSKQAGSLNMRMSRFNYRSTPIHVSRCAQSLAQLPPRCAPRCASRGNMAEIEIAILERNALSRCLPDEAALRRQVLAVETERNQQQRGICLPVHFT